MICIIKITIFEDNLFFKINKEMKKSKIKIIPRNIAINDSSEKNNFPKYSCSINIKK